MSNDKQLINDVFIEQLRAYNNGCGVTHSAQPLEEVARALAIEAYTIVKVFKATISDIESHG